MKRFLEWLDPYRQSCFYFKWGFWSLLFCVGASAYICSQTNRAFEVDSYGQVTGWLYLLDNVFVYLPNYVIHEMAGHNFVGRLGWVICYSSCQGVGRWWSAAMGNGVETLVPLAICIGALRLSGGRYILPFSLYWLSTTLYGAGIYAADARAMKLKLTSSDMINNFAPGEVQGDWYHILEPLGLLNYDVIIGHILVYLAVICLVLSIYSLWYYWTHTDQYLLEGRWN